MRALGHAGLSDRGRVRGRNEDRWTADAERGLFVVSDGIGGAAAGELASEIVVEALPALIFERLYGLENPAGPETVERVTAAIAELSDDLRKQSAGKLGLQGMGATVVVALVEDRAALIAHMGDSRAYLWREHTIKLLTRDHSLVQALLDAGETTVEQAADHPARGQLTRHVGMQGDPLPDARWLDLRAGDRLLLCTDGLTGMLDDRLLLLTLNEHPDPQGACRALVDAANEAGGTDNITALVVSYPP